MAQVSREQQQHTQWGGDVAQSERHNLLYFLREYARENPAEAAAWCFAVGFILGWRLKPW